MPGGDAIAIDGNAVAVRGDARYRATPTPPPCCCGTPGCPYYWRATRCPIAGCTSLDSISVCHTLLTYAYPGDPAITRPVQAGDTIWVLGHCWQVLGDSGGRYVQCPPPPPAGNGFQCLPPGAITIEDGAGPIARPGSCADLICAGQCYVRGTLCPGQQVPGDLCVAFELDPLLTWFAAGHKCAVIGVPTPGYNGGNTCYSATTRDPPTDDPSGCYVVSGGALYQRSCCACAQSQHQTCSSSEVPAYKNIFRNSTGLLCNTTQFVELPTEEACCGDDASITYDVTAQQFYEPGHHRVVLYTRTGTRYRPGRGASSVQVSLQLWDPDGNPLPGGFTRTETDPWLECAPAQGIAELTGGYAAVCGEGTEEYHATSYTYFRSGGCYGNDPPGAPCSLNPFTPTAQTNSRVTVNPGTSPGSQCLPCGSGQGTLPRHGPLGGLRSGPFGML